MALVPAAPSRSLPPMPSTSSIRSAADKAATRRHSRGPANSAKGVRKPLLKRTIKRGEKKIREAEKSAAQSEVLLPTEAGYLEAEGIERTGRFSQHAIAAAVDKQSQRKAYDVSLPSLGPYRVAYTADGRKVCLAGRKGHVAIANWRNGFQILDQIQVKETVRDVCFLRDHTMLAVAQHKNLYIYDNKGTELHCLRNQRPHVNRLAFLRYHWLLTTGRGRPCSFTFFSILFLCFEHWLHTGCTLAAGHHK